MMISLFMAKAPENLRWIKSQAARVMPQPGHSNPKRFLYRQKLFPLNIISYGKKYKPQSSAAVITIFKGTFTAVYLLVITLPLLSVNFCVSIRIRSMITHIPHPPPVNSISIPVPTLPT